MAHKFKVPIFPHAGGVGLCEYVQHLCMIDYVLINGEKIIKYLNSKVAIMKNLFMLVLLRIVIYFQQRFFILSVHDKFPLKSVKGVYIACPIEHFLIFLGVRNCAKASASGPVI